MCKSSVGLPDGGGIEAIFIGKFRLVGKLRLTPLSEVLD